MPPACWSNYGCTHAACLTPPLTEIVQEDSLQLLFDRLGAKGNLRVGPGMVKYGWQDGPVFNLDDGKSGVAPLGQ